MKKTRIIALLMSIFILTLLTACGQGSSGMETSASTEATLPPMASVTAPPDTQPAPSNPPATQAPTTVPPETAPPIPEGAVPLTQEELDVLRELFLQPLTQEDGTHPGTNWYNMAMTSHYETPAQLDLWAFFCEGEGGPEGLAYRPSEKELAFLETQPQIQTQLSVCRISKTRMDQVLGQYFGLSLENMDGVGLDRMAYFPETDSYYCSKGGMMYVLSIEAVEGFHLADGNIQFTYRADYRDYTMILKPVENGYQILSNIWLNSFI